MATSFFQRFLAGFRLIDGSDLNSALNQPLTSMETGVTATGADRAGAFPLKAATTVFSTVAAATGALLRADLPSGSIQTIYNDGASPLTVYAAGSATIDGTAGSVGVPLANAKRAQFQKQPDGNWISAQLGAVSA